MRETSIRTESSSHVCCLASVAAVISRRHEGPGEMGKAVVIPKDQQEKMKELFKINQFNLMASDMIALNRSLPDVRLDGCVNSVLSGGDLRHWPVDSIQQSLLYFTAFKGAFIHILHKRISVFFNSAAVVFHFENVQESRLKSFTHQMSLSRAADEISQTIKAILLQWLNYFGCPLCHIGIKNVQ